jgi:hypothetical protein
MVLEVVGADGGRQVHEVGIGGRPPAGHSAATLGLGLEEGKTILAVVQRHLDGELNAPDLGRRRRGSRSGLGARAPP